MLLLSGEADLLRLRRMAIKLPGRSSNSLHLVAPGQGHRVISQGCIPKIAAAFVERATVKGWRVTA